MENIKNRRLVILIFSILFVVLIATLFLNFNSKNQINRDSGVSGIDVDNGDSKVNWSKYKTEIINLSSSVEIKESGTYYIYGGLENGSITVDVGDTDGVVKLVLSGVSINCEDGPAIYIKSADDVAIEAEAKTENYLSSGTVFREFSDEDVNATIYSKGDLSFSGDGKLYVEAGYQDAIVSKDDLTIRSGKLEVVAADDGIRGKDSVYITGGSIKIIAKQDGIKSTNEIDSTKGFVYIEDGDIEIVANDDGIHATSSLIIDGGNINIAQSYEGLEGAKVVINNGEVKIKSNDDGINVAGGNDQSAFMRPGAQNFSDKVSYTLTINGGDLYVNAGGDGLDSNGSIYINGGNIVVDGPTNSANGALDSEIGIYYNGGSVVAVGASGMAEGFLESSLGYSVDIYFSESQAKGTEVSIKDEKGNLVLSHTSEKTFNHAVFGAEEFKSGQTYIIYVNGEKYETFTISSIVTTVGQPTGGVDERGGGGMMPIEPPDKR